MQTAGIEEARAALGELVERARLTGEPTLVTRYGKPAAVLVSYGWYERSQAAADAEEGIS